MESFEITLRSTEPIELSELDADGFQNLLATQIDQPFTWSQEVDGCICVTFRHDAVDRERAHGASERLANDLGVGNWAVSVVPTEAL